MQTFQLVVFLFSAFGLLVAAIALMEANMKAVGKGILFAILAVAARYLLGAVWTPEKMWLLWGKNIVIMSVFMAVWFKICKIYLLTARLWVRFVFNMALPVVTRFVFARSFLDHGCDFGSIAFWVSWTALSLWLSASLTDKMTMLGRVIVAVAVVLLFSFSRSLGSEARLHSYTGKLNDYLRSNVVERWEPIKQSTEKIVAAWDALVDLDRRATAKGKIGSGKIVASRTIKAQVAKLRKDLLTVESREVLGRVTKLDGKIASAKKTLSGLREKRGLNPKQAEKLDVKIAEAETNLAALESARAEAIATARKELKEIGLTLPENSPFLTVDLGALIDNAIVAKNISFVVENLKALVDADKGNAETAKRYYGAYIVMLDVHAECFRQYLDKAETGIWRDVIVDVAKNAEAAKKGNEIKAAADGRSDEEKKAFLHAAGTNEKTLKAAQAYLAILKRHEEVIREKLAATEKRHEIALSFWESVDIASTFGAKAISDMADFESLLELELPEIALFDDVAMKAEFDAITQKLME